MAIDISAPPVTDSDRLLAEGVELSLKNGETMRLILDFRTIKRLEDYYGSLQGAINSITDGNKLFTNTLTLLSKCLDVYEDDLVDKLITKKIGLYNAAFHAAVAQALPEVVLSKEDKSPNAEAVESNGNNSTTSQPSDSAAATESSGE